MNEHMGNRESSGSGEKTYSYQERMKIDYGLLGRIIGGVVNWDGLEKSISALPSEMQKGEAFEQFCAAFFILDPVYDFQAVYRWRNVPQALKDRLGHRQSNDSGIDAVAVKKDGRLFAIQMKFRSDRKKKPSLRELSTFFTVSDRADWRIVVSNCEEIPSSLDNRVRQGRVLYAQLASLDEDFFDRLRAFCANNIVIPPRRKTPRPDQAEAIMAAKRHYESNDRGQLIVPCGVGKSLLSLWISEDLGAGRVLVMVPSLALIAQMLREWAANTSRSQFRYICVCSDSGVDLGEDSPVSRVIDMDIPVSTEVNSIVEALSNRKDTVVFSTYHSSKVLAEAVQKSGVAFDLAVFDEAHRTAGIACSVWSHGLHDKNIPAKKRLFVTATPRVFAPRIKTAAEGRGVPIYSMDNGGVYGQPFFTMGFGQAIQLGLISDYKIVASVTSEREIRDLIDEGGTVLFEDIEWDIMALAKRVAFSKAIYELGLKKTISFHGSLAGAKAFADQNAPFGIGTMLRRVSASLDRRTYFISGEMSAGKRKSILREFDTCEETLISNARCLIEGVDVPAVDSVGFMDPKESIVDIVQATGRALRRAVEKKLGYIIIPVVLDDEDVESGAIPNTRFETVWRVLSAMKDQDSRLSDLIESQVIMQSRGLSHSGAWRAAMKEFGERVTCIGLPHSIDSNKFIAAFRAAAIDVVSDSWDEWFGRLLRFKDKAGHVNVPARYRNEAGDCLGQWVSHQRRKRRKGLLPDKHIAMLDSVGFVWDAFDEDFETGIREIELLIARTGSAYMPPNYIAPSGFKLWIWVGNRRREFKSGTLDSVKADRLIALGIDLNPLDTLFEKGFAELIIFYREFGHVSVPNPFVSASGFKLGSWVQDRRKNYKEGILSQEKIRRLEALGFIWDVYANSFEVGIEELVHYYAQNGDANAPRGYRSESGFRLGSWLAWVRKAWKAGRLSQEWVDRLNKLGIVWEPHNHSFDNFIRHLAEFKRQYGDTKVHIKYCAGEYRLGLRVYKAREARRKGVLSNKRIAELDKLGFNWDLAS